MQSSFVHYGGVKHSRRLDIRYCSHSEDRPKKTITHLPTNYNYPPPRRRIAKTTMPRECNQFNAPGFLSATTKSEKKGKLNSTETRSPYCESGTTCECDTPCKCTPLQFALTSTTIRRLIATTRRRRDGNSNCTHVECSNHNRPIIKWGNGITSAAVNPNSYAPKTAEQDTIHVNYKHGTKWYFRGLFQCLTANLIVKCIGKCS